MRIAFIQTSALGDVLMAHAVARRLRVSYPADQGHHITWIVFDAYADAALSCPDVDEVMAWPLKRGIDRRAQEPMQWALILEHAHQRFDGIVIPQVYPFHWDRYKPRQLHLLDQQFLNARLEVSQSRADRRLPLLCDPIDLVEGDRFDVTLNSRSVSARPVWTSRQWAELCEHLDGLTVVDGDPPSGGLAAWQATIARSGVYVGLDSGGSWLAAATDTPQVALYGEHPECPRWMTGIRAANVKADGLVHEMTAPSPLEVATKVRELLAHG